MTLTTALSTPRRRTLFFWSLQVVGWTTHGVLYFIALRPYTPFWDIVVGQVAATSALGLGVSSLLRLGFRWMRRRPLQPASISLIAFIVSVAAGLAWYGLSTWAGDWIDPFEGTIPVGLVLGARAPMSQMEAFVALLIGWSILYFGITYWEDQQHQRQRLLKADALAHQARLQMLRYQLNPHFLFNALNSISALADEEPTRVKAMVYELSNFLRYSLLDPDTFEVLLRDELRAARHYLAIEQIRFEEDLEVTWAVAPEAEEYTVPAFLVLPLVENAVKHGQMTSPMPLRIRLAGQRDGDGISLEVANTGTWMDPASGASSETPGTGTGLRNVRERLQEHYPDRYRFVHYEQDGWVHVRIDLYDHAQSTL